MLLDAMRRAATARQTPMADTITRLVQAYLLSVDNGDIERRLALFASDASLEDPVGTAAMIGHDALRSFWTQALGLSVRTELKHLAVNGDEAAYLFTALVQAEPGDTVEIRAIETIRVNADGLISQMRAHFDDRSIASASTGM